MYPRLKKYQNETFLDLFFSFWLASEVYAAGKTKFKSLCLSEIPFTFKATWLGFAFVGALNNQLKSSLLSERNLFLYHGKYKAENVKGQVSVDPAVKKNRNSSWIKLIFLITVKLRSLFVVTLCQLKTSFRNKLMSVTFLFKAIYVHVNL